MRRMELAKLELQSLNIDARVERVCLMRELRLSTEHSIDVMATAMHVLALGRHIPQTEQEQERFSGG
jgi:hypothetical protein